jgi:hypothetical protein
MQLGPLAGQILVFGADAGIAQQQAAADQVQRAKVVQIAHGVYVLVADVWHFATDMRDTLAPGTSRPLLVSRVLEFARQTKCYFEVLRSAFNLA